MSRTYRRKNYTPEWVYRPMHWRFDGSKEIFGTYSRSCSYKTPTKKQLEFIVKEYQRDGYETMEQCDAPFRRIRNKMLRSKNKQKMRVFLRDTDEYDDYEFVPDVREVLYHYW